jgi:hypothetical protein
VIIWEKITKCTFLRHLIDKTASAAISKIAYRATNQRGEFSIITYVIVLIYIITLIRIIDRMNPCHVVTFNGQAPITR